MKKVLHRGQYQEEKLCKTCKKPFSIRKKWKDNFEGVLYCSKRCKRKK